MRIYLTQTSDMNSALTSQDVISAYIAQKVENGYILNIGGTEVFAHCSLDLDIGDFLKVKVVESSTSQIILKIAKDEIAESQSPSKPLMSLDIPHTPEAQTSFNLLLKLNLPITKERIMTIMDLLSHLTDKERPEPLLLSMKEMPYQTQNISFHRTLTPYINSGSGLLQDRILELLKDFSNVEKDKTFSLNENLIQNRTKAAVIKEHLALKALSILHDKGSGNNISFYALPVPIYHNIYMKITEYPSTDNTQTSMHLSFIINTKNLGAILINLLYVNGKVTASSTFEDKKAMNTVKKFLDKNKKIQGLIKTMELKVGKISIKDFFFGGIKERPITVGINLKV